MDSSAYVWLDYAMIRSLSRRCRFRYLCLIKPLGPCRTTFIRKNFRINPLQRGLVGKFAFYRHLSRTKVRLNRCSAAPYQGRSVSKKEITMRLCTVGLVAPLALAVLVAPLSANAQPLGKVFRVGVLLPLSFGRPAHQAFKQRLQELGYIEGQNLAIEVRAAEGQFER